MGLVVIGMCIYLLFPIMLFGFTVVYISKKRKTVGFQKAVKSKPVIVSAVMMLLWVGFFLSFFIPRSSNQLFRDFILDPVPESVKILDSYDGGANFYPHTCFHFKISPDDFQRILETQEWEVDPNGGFGSFTCLGSEREWGFSSPSQKDNVVMYTLILGERDRVIMTVNEEMTEVYYRYFDGYLP